MIPGAASYKTLEKINAMQRIADDPQQPEALREQVASELAGIEAGRPVDPAYQRIRSAVAGAEHQRQAQLHSMAEAAVARVTADSDQKTRRRRQAPAPGAPGRWPATAFVQTWTSLDQWWTHYDPDELAAELTDEQITIFLTVAEGTAAFADRLRRITTEDPQTSTEPTTDQGEGDGSALTRGHLRAL